MEMIAAMQASYLEGLSALEDELRQFPDDAALWKTTGSITNSAGTLALHLVGNLQHFIGAQIGRTGYVRDREREFSTRGLDRATLIAQCESAADMIRATLHDANAIDLDATYPLATFGEGRSTGDVLLRLIGHFRYHLGQINYLRRTL